MIKYASPSLLASQLQEAGRVVAVTAVGDQRSTMAVSELCRAVWELCSLITSQSTCSDVLGTVGTLTQLAVWEDVWHCPVIGLQRMTGAPPVTGAAVRSPSMGNMTHHFEQSTTWRSCRKKWAGCAPSERMMGDQQDPYGRSTKCSSPGKYGGSAWGHGQVREAASLWLLATGGKFLLHLQICYFRIDTMPSENEQEPSGDEFKQAMSKPSFPLLGEKASNGYSRHPAVRNRATNDDLMPWNICS